MASTAKTGTSIGRIRRSRSSLFATGSSLWRSAHADTVHSTAERTISRIPPYA